MDQEYIHEAISMSIGDNEDEKGSETKRTNWLARQLSKQFNLPDHPVVQFITYVLIGFLIWTLLFLLLHDEVLLNGGLFNLLSLFVLAFAVGFAVSFAKLPPLLGMLITGIVLRAIGFFHVSGIYVQVVIVLRNIALTVILIKAGLGLDAPALMKLKFTVLKLGIFPCAGEAVATGILSYYFLGFPWLWAFLLGFLLSPISPAVVVPTLLNLKERGYGNDKGISTLVIAASSLDDIFSISIFGLLLSSIFSIGSLTMALIRGPLELLTGLVFGVVWGFVCSGFPHRDDDCLVLKRSLLIGLGGVVFILGSTYLNYPGAGPLACITAAFVTNISWQMQGWGFDKPNPVAQVYSQLWVMVQPVLFGLIGAEIDVNTLQLTQVINSIAIVIAALADCRMLSFSDRRIAQLERDAIC
ncbi:sodium/hydrogen exchanger 9B2-like isoform X2 [Cimex lectularius]|uniref:Cation/H+ exchanger transmembrane domain-containing protein n=1 Tax=Cimex lectularius TaxID=79782 RepID=A0A8I6RXX6_CIMLE|nr:sodium/hydrogen exchanger 9B2-like isoform X2 [Cimex lectularius]